jgi:subtilisin family serine protease
MPRSAGRRGSVLVLVPVLASLILALFAPSAVAAASHPAVERAKVIVMFQGPPGKAAERAIEKYGGKVDKKLALVNGLAARVPKGQLKQLAKEPGVKTVEPDVTVQAFDLEYDNAWGVKRIGTPAVHAAGVMGDGVKVAVIDTGIDYIHDDPDNVPYVVDPEFLHNYKGGYDFVNNDADPMDDNGHGTHVAGILAAEKNGYLVAGVAPHVDLYGLKILDAAGNGDESNLILALQWAVDHGMDVVNMSLGTHTNLAAMQTAVENAAAAGVLLVAASGNTVTFQDLLYGCPVAYPAAYPQVLSTTFTNQNDALTGFSCTGPEVDFASPGDNIFSTVPIGPCQNCDPHGYKALSGTSMASPHLAGAVALLLSAGITDQGAPGLFDDVRAQLCSTATTGFGVNSTPIPTSDPRYAKYFGCGVINVSNAVLPLLSTNSPVATDDTATTAEDTPASVPVLANDTDPNSDPLTVTVATDPPHGTAAVQGDGTVLYTPDANYNGPDSFSYTVSDGSHTDTGAVAVTVTSINDNPVAADDSVVAVTNTASTVAVLANDTDVDGDALSVTGATTPGHGSATVNGDGTITYQPNNGFTGADTFDYGISDGHGGSATGHVTVNVIASNSPPVAGDDPATVAEDGSADISVLANDSDPDGGALTVSAVGAAGYGAVSINANGTIHYVPVANYNGTDTFDYTVQDGVGFTDTGSVSVTVTPVNDNPVAADDSASTSEDASTAINVVGNDSDIDGDSLTPIATGGAPLGAVAINGNGTIQYTPPQDYYGSDSFSYTVSDGHGGTASANVSVTIAAVNDTPTAFPKTYTTNYATAVTASLTGADVETCDLTFQIVSGPAHGSLGGISSKICVTLLPPYSDGASVKYTPAAGWSGVDSFTYRVRDGVLWSAPATVTVTTTAPVLLHVGDLDGTTTVNTTTRYTINITVTVHNGTEGLVSGVTVTANWSGGTTGGVSCKTTAAGTCVLSKGNILRSAGPVTLTIAGLALSPTGVYVPGANHDPEADSNGTVIVLPAP